MGQALALELLVPQCAHCTLREVCAPAIGMPQSGVLPRIETSPALRRGGLLARAGTPARSLSVIRSGSLKSVCTRHDGEQQILAILLPGDLVGLECVTDGHYRTDLVALETTTVCSVDVSEISSARGQLNGVTPAVFKAMSRQIASGQGHQMLMGRRAAVQRVALFLLQFSERLATRGFVGHCFSLPLSRQDLANYLGLKVETVSRNIGRLREEGLVAVDRRLVTLLSATGLREHAGLGKDESALP